MVTPLDWETQVTLTIGAFLVVSAFMLAIPWLAMWSDAYRGRHVHPGTWQRASQCLSRGGRYQGHHRKETV